MPPPPPHPTPKVYSDIDIEINKNAEMDSETEIGIALTLCQCFRPSIPTKQLKADVCGHAGPPVETDDQQQEIDEQAAADDRDWKPEACFMAIDVEYGGNLVDLTSNMTRGPLEKTPGQESMWRVPHYVKVRGVGRSRGVWVAGCFGRGVFWSRKFWGEGYVGLRGG